LLELGVQTKFVSLKNEKESQTSGETETEVENEDPTVKEGQPDNVWDQVKLTVSGKENAAVETKLFFRSIPKLASEIVDGKVQFVEDFDDYGVQKLWSFDETWSNVSPVFAPCTSFSELEADGVTYKETSMMG